MKERTPEICLAALYKNKTAVRYVPPPIWEDTRFCREAVALNGDALQFVKEWTPEICLAAVAQNPSAINHAIPYRSDSIEHFEDNFKTLLKKDGFTSALIYELLTTSLSDNRKNDLRAFLAEKTLARWESEAREIESPAGKYMPPDDADESLPTPLSQTADERLRAQLTALFGSDESESALLPPVPLPEPQTMDVRFTDGGRMSFPARIFRRVCQWIFSLFARTASR